jgi:serine/threonine protein kinase
VPRWLDDPFAKPDGKAHHPHCGGPLAPDYLAFKAISQRGKGGVYEALDLSVSPARIVIIKEGRSHGETVWDGKDGYDRVKHEARVLRALRRTGVPVPAVFHEFDRDGNRYLVLEKIAGHLLLRRKQMQPPKPSWRRALKIVEQLGAALAQIHAAGWIWRDCKPSHIFLDRGVIRLIDFEGACRTKETELLSWGSSNYLPPLYRNSFCRRAGTLEDDYALGVIAFQFMCGEFPPPSARQRAEHYRRAHCPSVLRRRIEKLLVLR